MNNKFFDDSDVFSEIGKVDDWCDIFIKELNPLDKECIHAFTLTNNVLF